MLLALSVAVGPQESAPTAQSRPAPRLEPTVGVSSKLLFRQLVLDVGGDQQRELGLIYKPFGLVVGAQLYYRPGTSFDTGGWRGNFELGVESMLPMGSWPLSVQHSTMYEWKIRERVSFGLGGSVGLHLDVPDAEYSHAEVGVPLGLSMRRFDLSWVPSVSVPLQVRRRSVYSGELRRSIAPMFMPVNIVLRFGVTR